MELQQDLNLKSILGRMLTVRVYSIETASFANTDNLCNMTFASAKIVGAIAFVSIGSSLKSSS